MSPFFKTAILFLSVLIPLNCFSVQDSAETLAIQGSVQKPGQWSVEQLKEQFAGQIQEIKFRGGADYSEKIGTGIPLLSVIKAAEARMNCIVAWFFWSYWKPTTLTGSFSLFRS